MRGKWFLPGLVALGLAGGCAEGAMEPESPASQPRYNVSDAAPVDSAGSTPTGAAFGGGVIGSGT